jgi:Sel1 repeat
VAVMYRDGVGVEISKEKAFEWYHRAAVQGYSEAQFTVGEMYDQGNGVEQNEEKAFEWFQKAAEQGHLGAQYNVGAMYEEGQGVEENEEKAFEWFSKAAEQGCSAAQLDLSQCYGEGMGVGNDLLLATYWRIKSGLGSSTNGFSLDEDAELIKLIPSVMEKYSELKRIERIRLSTDSYFTQGHIAAIGIFIRSNYKVESLLIYSHASKLIDDQLIAFVDAVKFNTHLTSLKFVGVIISNEMNSQIEVLLTQNRDIAELRQYVKKHPLISTVDIPLELIKILDKKIIVSYLKSGQTKEATKNAIDEFLMIASTTALAKDSKTS